MLHAEPVSPSSRRLLATPSAGNDLSTISDAQAKFCATIPLAIRNLFICTLILLLLLAGATVVIWVIARAINPCCKFSSPRDINSRAMGMGWRMLSWTYYAVAVVTALQMDLSPTDHALIQFLAYFVCLVGLILAPLYAAFRIERYLSELALSGKGMHSEKAKEMEYEHQQSKFSLPGEHGSALAIKGIEYANESDKVFDMVFGPLLYGLKLSHWWFFLVVMASRLLDGFLISFLRNEPTGQIIGLLINAVILSGLYGALNPFLRETDYKLYTGMHLLRVMFLGISIGFVVKDGTAVDPQKLGIAVIVLHVCVCVSFVLIRVYDLIQKCRIACALANKPTNESNLKAASIAGGAGTDTNGNGSGHGAAAASGNGNTAAAPTVPLTEVVTSGLLPTDSANSALTPSKNLRLQLT